MTTDEAHIITPDISLHTITTSHAPQLMELMLRIYTLSYSHLWSDGGTAFIHRTYNHDQLVVDLSEEQTGYWFVNYKMTTIGILRILWDKNLAAVDGGSGVKLHRIYLDPSYSGLGVGSHLLQCVREEAIAQGKRYIWLETMDTAVATRRFYNRHNYQAIETTALEEALVLPEQKLMQRMVHLLPL